MARKEEDDIVEEEEEEIYEDGEEGDEESEEVEEASFKTTKSKSKKKASSRKKKGVEIPFNYEKINPSSFNFVSVSSGRAPTFDGTHYATWRSGMKMHLISLHPSVCNVVLTGVELSNEDEPPTP